MGLNRPETGSIAASSPQKRADGGRGWLEHPQTPVVGVCIPFSTGFYPKSGGVGRRRFHSCPGFYPQARSHKMGGSGVFGVPSCTAEGERGFLQLPLFGVTLCHPPPHLQREDIRRILVLTKFGGFLPHFPHPGHAAQDEFPAQRLSPPRDNSWNADGTGSPQNLPLPHLGAGALRKGWGNIWGKTTGFWCSVASGFKTGVNPWELGCAGSNHKVRAPRNEHWHLGGAHRGEGRVPPQNAGDPPSSPCWGGWTDGAAQPPNDLPENQQTPFCTFFPHF